MGVASPLFTHRMQAATNSLEQQTQAGHPQNAFTRPQQQPPALAAGQKLLLAPPESQPQPLPQLLHDRSLASIAARTVQP